MHLRHRKTAWSDPKFVQTDPSGYGYPVQERRCMDKKCNKVWRRYIGVQG